MADDDRLREIGTKLSQVAADLSDVASDMQGLSGGGEEGPVFGGAGGSLNRLGKVQLQPLAGGSVSRLRDSLKATLNKELARGGNSLGLQPGDLVAISSSVGQSISF